MPMPARPASSSSAGKIGIALGAFALVIACAVAVFLFIPKKGQLKIDIKSKSGAAIAKAEIFVDGVKRCDTAPCVVYDLAPGPKTIKVLSTDIATTAPVTESVEAGKERMVLITVEATGTGTGFKATSEQANVKV